MYPGRAASVVRWLVHVLLVLLVAIVFLLQPLPAQNRRWCPETVHVSAHFNYLLNFDSPAFLALAEHPSRILSANREWRERQSRPLYVLATWALAGAFRHTPGLRAMHPHPAYPGCIVLNLAVLVLSLALFTRIAAPAPRSWLFATVAGILLFANDSAKVFVWTPHQQLLGILEPLACIALVLETAERATLSSARAALCGAAAGMLVLLYGSFLLLLPAFHVGLLLRWRRGKEPSFLRIVGFGSVAALAFALPPMTWIGFVKHVTGTFYSAEIAEYQQFVWIGNAWRRGGASRVLEVLGGFTGAYTRTFGHELIVPAFAAAGVVILRLTAWEPTRAVVRTHATTLVACAVSLVLNLVFFWLLGLYAPRLTVGVMPPLLVAVTVVVAGVLEQQSSRMRRSALALLASSVALAQLYVVMKEGPWC